MTIFAALIAFYCAYGTANTNWLSFTFAMAGITILAVGGVLRDIYRLREESLDS